MTSENNALELVRCISPRHSTPDTLFPLDTRPSTLAPFVTWMISTSSFRNAYQERVP